MMTHYITEAEIESLKEDDALTINQLLFGAFGKGQSKRLLAVWNIMTDERYFVVENHKKIYHKTTVFNNAVQAYNEV